MSQPFRIASAQQPERQPERRQPVSFRFDGRRYRGQEGDTLAAALLANGIHLVGRSFKYHRPRGVLGLGAEEPNALVRVGGGDRAEPNLRATQVELHDGLVAESQNRWPSLGFDVGAVVGFAARLLPAGFYYKTFMRPARLWMAYERIIRRSAGLGRAPTEPDPDRYDKRFAHTDVLVAGGGPAGLAAALAAARSGARVILADENPAFGGNLLHRARRIDGAPAAAWVEATVRELAAMPNVTLLTRATVSGYYDHNFLTIAERVTDHLADPPAHLPRHRLWKIRAGQVVLATGAIERPVTFTDNDRPGIMLASAVRGYIHRYGVLCGQRMVLLTNNDDGYGAAFDAAEAGIEIAAIVDLRETPGEAVAAQAGERGLRVLTGHGIAATRGRRRVSAIDVRRLAADGGSFTGNTERITCDLVAMAGGWNPAVHLFSQAKGKLRYDEALAALVPGDNSAANRSAGACNGTFALNDCLTEGFAAGQAAAADAGHGGAPALPAPTVDSEDDGDQGPGAPLRMIWSLPGRRGAKRFVDFQSDVTVSDIELAAREGYVSVEHLKRYTALGMGTDQGKTSNVHGLAALAEATGRTVPQVGTTTFRPPYTPVTLGAIAGRDMDEFSHPVRRTAAHQWHLDRGASTIDAALWHRPKAYRRKGESLLDAINREALAVRNAVGVVDVTTLGKIDIQGPDAAELLNRLYVNAWSKLAVGRGRYGLMLREDGMVFDDGVTMRLGEQHFLMTTTTGNAGRVMQWIEYLLQTQWRDLRVYANSVTEQWFAAAINGPNARRLMAELTTDIDLSNEAFPMMAVREGTVAGIPARVMRISFSGELCYEVNVPADYGLSLWEAIVEAGKAHDLTAYGVEAMNVLRIEKGHVTAELDGRTTPDDLGLGAMVNVKKAGMGFIGKHLLLRPGLNRPDRLQLVGVMVTDKAEKIPHGALIVPENRLDPQDYLGHVTSLAYSPTLERFIGLALLRAGRARHGEILYAVSPTASGSARIEITAPVFIDPEGTRLHA